MHIGIDASSWPNKRGFGRFTRELTHALLSRNSGNRYTLFFDQIPEGSLPDQAQIVGVSTRRAMNEFVLRGGSRSAGYFWKMWRAVRQAKPDVFFFPASWTYFPIPTRVPCVICFHDAIPDRYFNIIFPSRLNAYLWSGKNFLARRQASRVMTVSGAAAKDIEHTLRIPPDQIDVVCEAASAVFQPISDAQRIERTLANYGLDRDMDLLVYLGGMNRHKNVDALLRAMLTVVAKRANTHLAIVGDITDKGYWTEAGKLQAIVASTPPLSKYVHFTGYISDIEVAELLNAAKALVFPSLMEGFGLPAVEAMACGTPVLASDRGSLSEVIGDAGLYFNPEDDQEMAECILGYLEDGKLMGRLSDIALARAKCYTWERAAEQAEISFRRSYYESIR